MEEFTIEALSKELEEQVEILNTRIHRYNKLIALKETNHKIEREIRKLSRDRRFYNNRVTMIQLLIEQL